MWWRLRLCFFPNRRQSNVDSPLIKASASTGAVEYMSIGFLRTSRTLSKCPLTNISECDEGSVSSSIITETNSSVQQVSSDDWQQVPEILTVCTSSRFFCSAPGSSSSIIEIESATPLSGLQEMVRDSLAVETYSASPYMDFKRSMLEMVEASSLMKKDATAAARWSFLQEMLHCYLELNHKSTHKLIIHAFVDLLLNLVVVDASDT